MKAISPFKSYGKCKRSLGTIRQIDKWTGQKLYAPDPSARGHNKNTSHDRPKYISKNSPPMSACALRAC